MNKCTKKDSQICPDLDPSRLKALQGTVREDMEHDRTLISSMSYSDSIRILWMFYRGNCQSNNQPTLPPEIVPNASGAFEAHRAWKKLRSFGVQQDYFTCYNAGSNCHLQVVPEIITSRTPDFPLVGDPVVQGSINKELR